MLNVDELIAKDVAVRRNKASRERALREYYKNPNYCLHCHSVILVPINDGVYSARHQKFCSVKCSVAYNKLLKPSGRNKLCSICGKPLCLENSSGMCSKCLKKHKDEERIRIWKETGDTGCVATSTLKNCIRDYIFHQQEGMCAICHMKAEWNGMELHFILDHFDGDASNNDEDNLRLICPNCDSQLDTYKSRNKNSARSHRRASHPMADELGGHPEPT